MWQDSVKTELVAAGGPWVVSALSVENDGSLDLLAAGCLIGHSGSADTLPGGKIELQSAVVTVAGVDVPVASRLTLRETIPHGSACGGRCRNLLGGCCRDGDGLRGGLRCRCCFGGCKGLGDRCGC